MYFTFSTFIFFGESNSPIIDLKGYFPVCDRVKDVKVPTWASDWSQWYPDEGLSLDD